MKLSRLRILLFAVGFVLICFAQYLMGEVDSVFLPLPFAANLNDWFRFDLPNLENTITASALLLLATVLILFALAPIHLPASEAPLDETRPLDFLRRHLLFVLVGAVLFCFLIVQMHLMNASALLIPVWMIAVGLGVFLTWRYDREAHIALSLHITRWDLFWLTLLLIGGLVIGSYQLDSVPNSLVRDEGNFWERAHDIATGKEDHSFFDIGVYTYPLASSFYQGAVLDIFGFSLWSWRFASVLASVLNVIPLYLLARDMFDRRTAVIAGVVLITLAYFISFERLGYNNSQSILPVALTIYLLYVAVQRESLFYYALSGVAAGLGFYTYTASRLGLLVGVVFLAALIVYKGLARWGRTSAERKQAAARQVRRLLLASMIFVGIALATLLPQIVYADASSPDLLRYKTLESLFPNSLYACDFFPDSALYRDYPPIHIGDLTFFYRPDLYARLLVRGVVRTLLAFHNPSIPNSHYLDAPLAGTISVVFFFVGLVIVLRNLRRKGFLLLLFWWFGGLIFLSMISTFPARYQHFVPIIPLIALFIALGLIMTVDYAIALLKAPAPLLRRLRVSPPSLLRFAPGLLLSGLLAVALITNVRNYFVEMPTHYYPLFEDIMGFQALHLTQPTTLIYVYSSDDLSNWKPWLINSIPTQATFQTISIASFKAAPPYFVPGQPYTLYFDQDGALIVKTVLRDMFGSLSNQPTTYRDDLDRVLGLSYSFVGPPLK